MWQSLVHKAKNEEGAYLIEASVVLLMVFALFFVIIIVLVNVFQTGHLDALAQDSLNYAIERCGTTFTGGFGRDATLATRITTAVRNYINNNTSYTVVTGEPKNKNQLRIRVAVGIAGSGGRPPHTPADPVAVTLYLDTRSGGFFGNQPITVMRGGQIGQEWVRGMGDDP